MCKLSLHCPTRLVLAVCCLGGALPSKDLQPQMQEMLYFLAVRVLKTALFFDRLHLLFKTTHGLTYLEPGLLAILPAGLLQVERVPPRHHTAGEGKAWLSLRGGGQKFVGRDAGRGLDSQMSYIVWYSVVEYSIV